MAASDDLNTALSSDLPDDMATIRVTQPASAAVPDDLQTLIVAKPAANAPLPDASVMGANPDSAVPFVFGRRIAKGGMGAILEGDDCKLGRKIAVKVMLDANASAEQTQRFVQEAAVLGRLAHPNIVPIHDLGRDSDGALYYTMKLVKGVTLQQILDDLRHEKKEALEHYTLDRLLTIFRKVCDALAFAHAQKIIHRDLKPENIMVGEFGEVLVMDWGIAKILDDSRSGDFQSPSSAPLAVENRHSLGTASLTATMEGAVMGTPNYMSPEQAMGKVNELDERSDIFSLGGILYAVLTLRPPVEGKDVWEVLEKVQAANITPPTIFGATVTQGKAAAKGAVLEAKKITPLPHMPGGRVPPALSAVAMKSLTLDKARRYQTVAALSADVEAYQNGFATSAEKAGAWKLFTLFLKRNKPAAIGVAAVFVLSLGFTAKVVAEGRRAERALGSLHKAAPSLVAQAQALVGEQKLDAAVEQLDFALAIDPENTAYALERANYLQAAQHLREAADAYRGVLRSGANAAASANLALCEKLLAAQGGDPLSESALDELRVALIAQHREMEAVPLIVQLGKGKEAIVVTLRERLAMWRKLPDWHDERIRVDWDGRILVILGELATPKLRELPITDLSPLRGLYIEKISLGRSPVTDLRPLAGMRLVEFGANNAKEFATLDGLENSPLRIVSLSATNVSDLSALRGCRTLETLMIERTRVTDLSPIRDCPLTSLQVSSTAIRSLEPLRGMKTLGNLQLGSCMGITDLSPLADCPNLRNIELPPRATGIEVLRKLPNVSYISFKWDGPKSRPAQTAAEFWKEYDAQPRPAGK